LITYFVSQTREIGNVQTNGRFLNPIQQRYLAKLLKTFPPELNTVYLVNSGSEANDLALRIARSHNTAKNKDDVIVLDSAYHGHTAALIGISPYKWYILDLIYILRLMLQVSNKGIKLSMARIIKHQPLTLSHVLIVFVENIVA
jgi:acetylornithine/succinyldiaminopimelate/putrescine aminotransferase